MNVPLRRILRGGLVLLLPGLLFLSACSDDPILGPPDEPRDDGGGSYSVIKRLAPAADTAAADSSASPLPRVTPPVDNPEQF